MNADNHREKYDSIQAEAQKLSDQIDEFDTPDNLGRWTPEQTYMVNRHMCIGLLLPFLRQQAHEQAIEDNKRTGEVDG